MKNRTFDAKLRIVGNSFIITIPKSFVKKCGLMKGDFLEIEIKGFEKCQKNI